MALAAHMCSINMQWSATIKESVTSTIFVEIPILWKRFWIMLSLFTLVMVGVIIMSTSLIPFEWQVRPSSSVTSHRAMT